MSLVNKPVDNKKEASDKASALALAKSIIQLMNDLVQVLNLEIDLVSARKMEEHKELLKRKQRITIDYRASLKAVAAQADLFKLLPDDVRAALRTAAQKLAEVADKNAKFLRNAVMATQRLIQNIVSIVKQEVLPTSSYRNPNTAHLALGNYSPTCKPVSVNRTA